MKAAHSSFPTLPFGRWKTAAFAAGLVSIGIVAWQAAFAFGADENAETNAGQTEDRTERRVLIVKHAKDGDATADVSGLLRNIDFSAIADRLDGALDKAKIDQIITAIKGSIPNIDVQAADGTTVQQDVKVVRAFRVQKEDAQDGNDTRDVQARVVIKEVDKNGNVTEKTLEGDEAVQHIEQNSYRPWADGAEWQAKDLSFALPGAVAANAEVEEIIDENGNSRKIMKYRIELNDEAGGHEPAVFVMKSDGAEGQWQAADGQGELETEVDVRVERIEGEDGNVRIRHLDADGEEQSIEIDLATIADGDEEAMQYGKAGGKMLVIKKACRFDGQDFIKGKCKGAAKVMFVHLDMTDIDGQADEASAEDLLTKVQQSLTDARIVVISDNDAELAQPTGSQQEKQNVTTPDRNPLAIDNLAIYPNPNGGVFNLDFELPSAEPATVRLVDLNGREVYREEFSDVRGKVSKQIDLSSDSKGVYILNINQGQHNISKRIEIK